jgi:alkyl sulfatase BDS1-like metallo-beta-lactamase superfamily hydrolase
MNNLRFAALLLGLALAPLCVQAQKKQPANSQQEFSKPATTYTTQANKKVLQELDFNQTIDFQNASRNLIAPLDYSIRDAKGNVVWDISAYDFLNKYTPETCPPELNPSLWRQERLNNYAGLFEVTDSMIYQIRGFDLSVMSLIRGNTGWIVMDPLVTVETARAGIEMAKKNLDPNFKVSAVIFTHSHIDHYGGVLGVIRQEEANNIPILAPEGFLEHAFNENIMAGTAMGRRATYMYGNTIALHDVRAQVGSGLGKTTAKGKSTIVKPNVNINATIENPYITTVDGVTMHIWNTPNTEAPTEMMFYFPDFNALCSAEEVTQTMHNTYSLRGTMVRDPLAWSQYIDQTLIKYGKDLKVVFASHHWPTWGNDTIMDLLKKQRDLYKFINDQTLRLTNQGYTMIEIAEMVKLPRSLNTFFPDRGYYGTLNHNLKATYQRYIGWFDGNPANLHSLEPTEAGIKYVEFMGGPDSVMAKAQRSYNKGEYRWVGMVLNHLVFAIPNHMPARNLLADAYEQMGYQAESGPWRNFYLTGARELRDTARVNRFRAQNNVEPNRDDLDNMDPQEYFQYLSVHLNPEVVEGANYTFNVMMQEKDGTTTLAFMRLENSVLRTYPKVFGGGQYPIITLDRSTMNDIMILGRAKALEKFNAEVAVGKAKFYGSTDARKEWDRFLLAIDNFPFWFNIIEP